MCMTQVLNWALYTNVYKARLKHGDMFGAGDYSAQVRAVHTSSGRQ